MRKTRAIAAAGALAAVSVFAGTANADLMGTTMDLTMNHTGPFGELVGGTYEYGTSQDFFDSFGFSWNASSPAGFPGFDNSILIDFTDFAYLDFAGETATMSITQLAKGVIDDSLGIFNANGVQIGFNLSSSGTALSGQYLVDDVLNAGDLTIVIAWNQIPAPGAMALLGMAGLVARRRRRRS